MFFFILSRYIYSIWSFSKIESAKEFTISWDDSHQWLYHIWDILNWKKKWSNFRAWKFGSNLVKLLLNIGIPGISIFFKFQLVYSIFYNTLFLIHPKNGIEVVGCSRISVILFTKKMGQIAPSADIKNRQTSSNS